LKLKTLKWCLRDYLKNQSFKEFKMKKILLITLLLIVGCSKEPINYKTTLVEKDSVFYTKDTNKGYSGAVFSLYEVGGQKEEEGTLKDGKKNGLWTSWYSNGQKEKEGTLKDGKKNGLWTVWWKNGQKWSEGTFRDGKEDGTWTMWYENGQKRVETTYEFGYADGLWTSWYSNGQKKKEGTLESIFFNSIRVGLWTEWSENGQKEQEGTYKNGRKDGVWTYLDNDGSKYVGKVEREDDEDGTFLGWYFGDAERKVESYVTYKDGKEDGLKTYWHENGQKYSEGIYKVGNVISEKCWDEVGNEMECWDEDENETEPPGPAPPGKVWSPEHGHWHDVDDE